MLSSYHITVVSLGGLESGDSPTHIYSQNRVLSEFSVPKTDWSLAGNPRQALPQGALPPSISRCT